MKYSEQFVFLGCHCLFPLLQKQVNTTGGAGPSAIGTGLLTCAQEKFSCVMTEGTSTAINTISGWAVSREIGTKRLLEGISGPGMCAISCRDQGDERTKRSKWGKWDEEKTKAPLVGKQPNKAGKPILGAEAVAVFHVQHPTVLALGAGGMPWWDQIVISLIFLHSALNM